MEEYGELPSNLLKYCNIPLKNLHISGRVWLSHNLNPERPTFSSRKHLLKDWRGMAEYFNFDQLYIENFQRLADPMGEVIKNLPIMNPGATLGCLLLGLWHLERFDILEDSDLVTILEKCPISVQSSLPESQPLEQVAEIDSQSEAREFLTVGESETGEPEKFDAFVCYTRQDIGFVQEIINELEAKKHFKLCIPDRDVLPGPAKYDAYTKLIKERCGPMIIVLSPDYNKSEECKFLTYFAHSLGPDAKHQKLIPVVYKHCNIPNVLSHISLVDYTRSDVIEWFWSRLSNSIQSWRARSYSSGACSFSYPFLPSYHSQNSLTGFDNVPFTKQFETTNYTYSFDVNVTKTQNMLHQTIVRGAEDTDRRNVTKSNTDHSNCSSFTSLENGAACASLGNNILQHMLVTDNQGGMNFPRNSSNESITLRRVVSDEPAAQNRINEVEDFEVTDFKILNEASEFDCFKGNYTDGAFKKFMNKFRIPNPHKKEHK